jgi:hypothetical protein
VNIFKRISFGFEVNGSKTWAGILGLCAYLVIQWQTDQPVDETVVSAFLALAGIGGAHKAIKAVSGS